MVNTNMVTTYKSKGRSKFSIYYRDFGVSSQQFELLVSIMDKLCIYFRVLMRLTNIGHPVLCGE